MSFGFGCQTRTDRQTDGRQLHSPGRSRRSPRTPSSSSSAGTQSTRSGTWPPRGWGRRSSCGRGAGPGSWRRAADAQSLCIREAVDAVIERSDRRTGGSGSNRRRQGLLCGSLDSLPEALRRHLKATSCCVAVSTPDNLTPQSGCELWVWLLRHHHHLKSSHSKFQNSPRTLNEVSLTSPQP